MKRIILLITIIALVSCATPAHSGNRSQDEWLNSKTVEQQATLIMEELVNALNSTHKGIGREISRMPQSQKVRTLSNLGALIKVCSDKKAQGNVYKNYSMDMVITICVTSTLRDY